MRVCDLMVTDVVTATPSTPLKEAARELAARGVSGLPVVDGDARVVGVLSEADILAKEIDGTRREGGALRRFLEGPLVDDRFDAVTVGDAMSAPALVIDPDQTVAEAAALMLGEGINRLPVVDGPGTLVGIVTRADLVRAFARDDDAIRDEIVRTAREDLWIDPTSIAIDVQDGVVTVDGTVENDVEARALATFARRVPGVVEVRSALATRV